MTGPGVVRCVRTGIALAGLLAFLVLGVRPVLPQGQYVPPDDLFPGAEPTAGSFAATTVVELRPSQHEFPVKGFHRHRNNPDTDGDWFFLGPQPVSGFILPRRPGVGIAGQVVDPRGRIQQDVQVSVVDISRPGQHSLDRHVDDGSFLITDVQTGHTYQILAKRKKGNRVWTGSVMVTPPEAAVLIVLQENSEKNNKKLTGHPSRLPAVGDKTATALVEEITQLRAIWWEQQQHLQDVMDSDDQRWSLEKDFSVPASPPNQPTLWETLYAPPVQYWSCMGYCR